MVLYRTKRKKMLFFILVNLLALWPVSGTDIYVGNNYTVASCTSDDYKCPTIQDGLALAQSGDVVFLEPGTYTGLSNYNLCSSSNCATNITLSGLGPPENVIISCEGTTCNGQRSIYAIDGTLTKISNITIQNFNVTRSLTNSGTVFVQNGTILFDSVVFYNNMAQVGGALNLQGAIATFKDCKFDSNMATINGGALSALESSLYIHNSIFTSNNATTMFSEQTSAVGGALYYLSITQNMFHVRGSKFTNNLAERGGGAIYLQSSTNKEGNITIEMSEFSQNRLDGAGACLATSSCNSRGGALYLSVSSVDIRAVNFTENHAASISVTLVRYHSVKLR